MSAPPTPTTAPTTTDKVARQSFIPLVAVVDFHHARGPEVERWFGVEEGRDPAVEYDWPLLPFMALSDGAHALTEDFSYFTLLRPATSSAPATSLFGISCTRQMDAAQLLHRPADVTRSTVQKAVVVVADSPQYFGVLRERLSVVTKAWFHQREFTDVEILRRFQESLADEKARGLMHEDEDRDTYLGLSLRELVREFRWQTLVLLKCCLLQPKMLFFGTRCERLCLTQFSLISLIPGLLRNLQDSAGPELDSYQRSLTTPTSLRTSDRNSLLSYMGLPLQIFGKGSLFGPYTPLQQLDILADFGTKSYIVGSTNSLLLQQKDRYSDILINLDEGTISITSPSLKAALQLSTPDRRWIDFITQNVNDTWDETNPSRPKTMGYVGSEEFIRVQFEEYLLSLISSVKYHAHLAKHANNPRMLLPEIDGDPSHDFGPDFIDAWVRTENFRIWNAHTDSHLFDIVEPRHPCAGGLTIDDIQRRITQQVQDLHWDERFAQGREVLGRNLAAGKEKASTLFNKLYADMEALREAQRKRNEEARALQQPQQQQQQGERNDGQQQQHQGSEKSAAGGTGDLGKAQQTMQTVGSKAGAFVNSWAAWAGEKRRAAWGKSSTSPTTAENTPLTSTGTANNRNSTGGDSRSGSASSGNRGGGWGASWGRSSSGNSNNSSKNRASLAHVAGYETVQQSSGRDDDGHDDDDDDKRLSMASKRTTGDYSAEQGLLNRYSRGESISGESAPSLSSPKGIGRRPVGEGGVEDGGEDGSAAVTMAGLSLSSGTGSGPVVNGKSNADGNGTDTLASRGAVGRNDEYGREDDGVSGRGEKQQATELAPSPLPAPPSSAERVPDAAATLDVAQERR